MGKVRRRLRRWSLGRDIRFGQAAIDDKIGAIDEAALVAGKEEDRLRLLDGFAKAARWEVNLAAKALGRIVAQPVLEEGRAGEY